MGKYRVDKITKARLDALVKDKVIAGWRYSDAGWLYVLIPGEDKETLIGGSSLKDAFLLGVFVGRMANK
jgi:hypothetical protein